MTNDNVALREPVLSQVLSDLVRLDALISSVRHELTEPLTDEDRAAGAQDRTTEEIAADLKEASQIIWMIAVDRLQVDPTKFSELVLNTP